MWKPVPGNVGYEVAHDGRVRNTTTRRVLTPMWTGRKDVRQYATVRLPLGDAKVHRLVLLAFQGPPPPDRPYALHRDDNTRNNRLSNLYWGSPAENARTVRMRRDQKISAADRRRARKKHAAGVSLKALAAEFGLSYVRMWEICNTHWELEDTAS